MWTTIGEMFKRPEVWIALLTLIVLAAVCIPGIRYLIHIEREKSSH